MDPEERWSQAHDVLSLGQAPMEQSLPALATGSTGSTEIFGAKVEKVSLELPVVEPPASPKPVATKKKGTTTSRTAAATKAPTKAPAKKPVPKPFDGTVFSFTRDGDQIYAATSAGVLVERRQWSKLEYCR